MTHTPHAEEPLTPQPDQPQPPSTTTTGAGETTAGTTTPDSGAPVWLATQVGRIALRWSRYPGRRLVGSYRRRIGRRRGGVPFTVHSDTGVTLHAWYSPAAKPRPDRLPIVMMHGWIEVKECHFPRAWRLNRAGHDVIMFDHRAHGRSTGRGATFGACERHDLAAVIEAAGRHGYLGPRYTTMGFSMGAAVALQHAAHDPQVAGVVAFAPYLAFEQALCSFREKLAPWADERWLVAGFERAAREMGFGFDQTSTLEAVRRLEAPVLLVEGGCDRNLPPAAHTRKLAAAKTRGRLEHLTIDQANHMTLCRLPWPGLDRAVADFCRSLM